MPVTDDVRLYEKMCLEGFQSGLSWLTILRKRENFRAAFSGFDFEAVARFDDADVERLMGDAGIVRHRGKIEATINNARAALDTIESHGSLAAFFWSFEPNPTDRPAVIEYQTLASMPTTPSQVGAQIAQRNAIADRTTMMSYGPPPTNDAIAEAVAPPSDSEDC